MASSRRPGVRCMNYKFEQIRQGCSAAARRGSAMASSSRSGAGGWGDQARKIILLDFIAGVAATGPQHGTRGLCSNFSGSLVEGVGAATAQEDLIWGGATDPLSDSRAFAAKQFPSAVSTQGRSNNSTATSAGAVAPQHPRWLPGRINTRVIWGG